MCDNETTYVIYDVLLDNRRLCFVGLFKGSMRDTYQNATMFDINLDSPL
jgi:hypothetical protein